MKTNEQIKKEIINYLEKTSKHLFQNEKGETLKVFLNGDSFSKTRNKIVFNINDYVNNFGPNAKCVIKHILFLNRGLKSVKQKKELISK